MRYLMTLVLGVVVTVWSIGQITPAEAYESGFVSITLNPKQPLANVSVKP